MKNLPTRVCGFLTLGLSDLDAAQSGNVMDGGMHGTGWMGGYGGYWGPVLLLIVIGLVAWIVMRKRK